MLVIVASHTKQSYMIPERGRGKNRQGKKTGRLNPVQRHQLQSRSLPESYDCCIQEVLSHKMVEILAVSEQAVIDLTWRTSAV